MEIGTVPALGVVAPDVGVVAIGRNEGERLRRCLASVREQCTTIVYVDSGSEDGSVAAARNLGVEVVELDLSIPFTAARARNAGLAKLREIRPDVELVQFVDGDCELVRGWIPSASKAMSDRADLAVVCGRRRERHPDATVYNLLCDLEWDTPVGDAEACGGDALMRVAALDSVGGFDERLIAGEEPDLCLRLRKRGFAIRRIDAEMTLHDAAMTRLGQWAKRMMRSGYASAESLARNGGATPAVDRRCVRGALVWVVGFPLFVLAGAALVASRGSATGALLVLAAGAAIALLQIVRVAVGNGARGRGARERGLYALACMAGKVPQTLGMVRYLGDRARSGRPTLIEYK
jgi:GT2 family glycosyltransferase